MDVVRMAGKAPTKARRRNVQSRKARGAARRAPRRDQVAPPRHQAAGAAAKDEQGGAQRVAIAPKRYDPIDTLIQLLTGLARPIIEDPSYQALLRQIPRLTRREVARRFAATLVRLTEQVIERDEAEGEKD